MPGRTVSQPPIKLVIRRALEFSSQTLRSGAVVESSDAPKGTALLFLRGAPAVIRNLVDPSTVPKDFDQVSCNLIVAQCHAAFYLCRIAFYTPVAIKECHARHLGFVYMYELTRTT